MSLPSFGRSAQEKLSRAHVVCIGAGGLGSPALLYLAAAGIGRITLIDDDTVEETNLHRQIIHDSTVIGVSKIASSQQRLAALNPELRFRGITQRFLWPDCVDWCKDADLIIDGSDNFNTRYVASTTAATLNIPHVWASILGYEAQMSVFGYQSGPIYEDVFPIPPKPGDIPNCAQAGVLGPVVGIIGSAMALEAIKIITGVGQVLSERIGYFDALHNTWEYIPLKANPEVKKDVVARPPRQMQDIPEVDTIPDDVRAIIDVREVEEFAAGAIPGAINIPLSTLKTLRERPTEVPDGAVLYCAGGIRSQSAWLLLDELGVTNHVSLRGGYMAWHS